MTCQATTGYRVTRAFAALIVALTLNLAMASYLGQAHAQEEGEGDGATAEDSSGSGTFDPGFTDRTVADGEGRLNQCIPVEQGEKRINCVADALEAISRRLSYRADYYSVARVFRDTAVQVRAAKVVGVALKVLTIAKKNVLRAYGDKTHLARLGTLMDKAKSVLRS